MQKKGYNISKRMFDVRPLDWSGSSDIGKTLNNKKPSIRQNDKRESFPWSVNPIKITPRFFQLNKDLGAHELISHLIRLKQLPVKKKLPVFPSRLIEKRSLKETVSTPKKVSRKNKNILATSFLRNFFGLLGMNYSKSSSEYSRSWSKQKLIFRPAMKFAFAVVCLVFLLASGMFLSHGLQLKSSITSKGKQALGFLALAKDDLKNKDFISADHQFANAKNQLQEAQKQINALGGDLLNVFAGLPMLSKASTGKNLVESANHLTDAARSMSTILSLVYQIKNPFAEQADQKQEQSLVDIFLKANQHIGQSKLALNQAQENLNRVRIEDLPMEYQTKVAKVKEAVPLMIANIDGFEKNSQILLDILGHNGPRKYLFLFQNNNEMRATGGFVGSYGILDISDGRIKNLFIDGIYNPGGQLYEKVVPPEPIQKISAAWSMHDANWFPDFPTSAEKISWFYEKTGGPTVDGVIALTPTVLQDLLEITGPIEMSEYSVTVDKDNFIEKTQYEVEVNYDKKLNQPKKFVADLAPEILNRIFAEKDIEKVSKVFSVLSRSLSQKHILLYSFNYNLQKIISTQGWSGEVLNTSRDFLMVINSNINGFKTDGIIDETISHHAEVQADGSVINTVQITRKHNGGNTNYEWWNKVNCDYLRLYVPKGSQLLAVKGNTREFTTPPLDYAHLGFRRDPNVEQQEQSMQVDEKSGTRIYQENEKTVFANWLYVSPQETAVLEYKYMLPFKVDLSKNNEGVDTYSLLVQKQSGSLGSNFISTIDLPENMSIAWRYPETVEISGNQLQSKLKLTQDQFFAVVAKRR